MLEVNAIAVMFVNFWWILWHYLIIRNEKENSNNNAYFTHLCFLFFHHSFKISQGAAFPKLFILQNINLASSFIKQGTMDCLSVMSAAGNHILWAFTTCTCVVWSWGGHLTCCQHLPAWRWQMGSNNHKYVFFSGYGPGVPKILTNTGISAFLAPISSPCYYIYFYFNF